MKVITDFHCSSLSRVMTCSGSAFFDLPRPEAGAAAEEGTAAGEFFELLLTKGDRSLFPTHAKNGVAFDDDMKFFTSDLANDVFNRAKSPILCEQKIDWLTQSGIWVKGKYDASYELDENTLCVDDLKYGWVHVEVKENWQLLGYAIGEIIRRGKAYERIILRILQPRPYCEDGPIREWVLTYPELLAYKERIETKMLEIAAGNSELVTSPKCKYCPAAAGACVAFNRAFYNGVDVILNDFVQDDVPDATLANQLDLLARVVDVMKIKKDSLEQLAVDRIKHGKIIPGYVTEESYGDRKWKKEVSPDVIEALTGKKIVETVMLSPAKAEKLGVPKDLVKTFVDRSFVGNKLVKKDSSKLAAKIFGGK